MKYIVMIFFTLGLIAGTVEASFMKKMCSQVNIKNIYNKLSDSSTIVGMVGLGVAGLAAHGDGLLFLKCLCLTQLVTLGHELGHAVIDKYLLKASDVKIKLGVLPESKDENQIVFYTSGRAQFKPEQKPETTPYVTFGDISLVRLNPFVAYTSSVPLSDSGMSEKRRILFNLVAIAAGPAASTLTSYTIFRLLSNSVLKRYCIWLAIGHTMITVIPIQYIDNDGYQFYSLCKELYHFKGMLSVIR